MGLGWAVQMFRCSDIPECLEERSEEEEEEIEELVAAPVEEEAGEYEDEEEISEGKSYETVELECLEMQQEPSETSTRSKPGPW